MKLKSRTSGGAINSYFAWHISTPDRVSTIKAVNLSTAISKALTELDGQPKEIMVVPATKAVATAFRLTGKIDL